MKQLEAARPHNTPPPPIPPVPDGARVGNSSSLPAPRLANNAPPILTTPVVVRDGEPLGQGDRPQPGSTHREYHSAPISPREFFAKPPKHDFPKFDGSNPHLWFDLCHTYFEMYLVPQHQWLSVASLYFSGHAALWWQAYKSCYSVVN